MIANENLINIKVEQLIEIYNFYFGYLVILTKFEHFKFEILKNDKFQPIFKTQIDFNIKSDEYQNCSTHEYLQLFILVISSFDKFLAHIVH